MTKLKGIVPMLETADLAASVEYYQSILGFKCDGTWPPEGELCWASMRRDDAIIMLCSRNENSKHPAPAFTGTIYLYPENVDLAWKEVREKADIAYEIETFEYGMREFGIHDPDGYLLQFGQDENELEQKESTK